MNLWAKTLRQLTILSVALFFFSCEDESSLLGFKNPRQKFNVHYVDIPLTTSQVMSVDSVTTDLRPYLDQSQRSQAVEGIVVGQYQDPDFGLVSAQPFLSVYPVSQTALHSTAVFDSITVQLRLNFYAYGFSGIREFRVPVHEITGDTLSLFGGRRYYSNSSPPAYGPDPLGEATVSVDREYLLTEADSAASAQDTLLLRARLTDEYGLRVFNAIKGGFTTSEQQKLFRAGIKGLTLAPGAEPGALGMDILSQPSRIYVHYHTLTEGGAVDDTLSTTLGFEFSSFTNIEADRAGTELAALTAPYQTFEPVSGQRYVQSGAAVITKIDLAPFYAFADTVENILINSAEFVISSVTSPEGVDPHEALMLRPLSNDNNQFLNIRMAADVEVARNYFVTTASPSPYFFAASETATANAATISHDEEDNRFSGFMTLFAQTLFDNKNDQDGINDNRLKSVALVPPSVPIARSNVASSSRPASNPGITRTLFNKDNISLRIFYTRANGVTP